MENASKALIIAGSILVAILIISLGVMIYKNFANTAKDMANMDKQEIQAFNSKIVPYLGDSIPGSQVNALLQYCLSVNISANNSGETYKCIEVTGKSTLAKDATSYTKVATGGKYYKVEGTYDNNGLITLITISE